MIWNSNVGRKDKLLDYSPMKDRESFKFDRRKIAIAIKQFQPMV